MSIQNTPRYSNKYRGMDQINQAVDPMQLDKKKYFRSIKQNDCIELISLTATPSSNRVK